MKTPLYSNIRFLIFFLFISNFTTLPIYATKLVKVQVIDQSYIEVHFIDSEVIYNDDSLGDTAFTNAFNIDQTQLPHTEIL